MNRPVNLSYEVVDDWEKDNVLPKQFEFVDEEQN